MREISKGKEMKRKLKPKQEEKALPISSLHALKCNTCRPTPGYWDNSVPPAMTVESGDVVEMQTLTHLQGRMAPGTRITEWIKWYRLLMNQCSETFTYPDPVTGVKKIKKGAAHHSLSGPVYVRGATPGDVLQVEILSIIPNRDAFNLIPEASFLRAGLLPDDFQKGQVKWYRANLKKMKVTFLPGIEIRLRPFPGSIGVELPKSGSWSNVPPGRHGGNIDNKELVEGTVLYLPIWVHGAGLKTGDSHLTQGNGEVDLNGLEGGFKKIRLRLTVRKDLRKIVDWPMASTRTHWITMGFHTNLLESCKMATRKAIELLNKYYGLPKNEAYAFCSMAVDLQVTQVVDLALGVHAMIPKECFVGRQFMDKNGLLLNP
jgi:acetamidase/formamidase